MMEFYKGYLLTENKVSHEKRSGRKSFSSLAEVQNSPEYAGVLADGIVLVDFDDGEQAETALKIVKDYNVSCRAVQTTRGVHMLFSIRKQLPEGTHCVIACGLTADFKIGNNNSYEVLKYGGVQREIILDTGISELPYFFYPVTGFHGDLWKMKDGDGRDNALFSYEITCARNGLSEDQIRNLIPIINDYVFADRLSDSDIKRITRPEAIKEALNKALTGDKKPDTRLLADLMIGKDYVVKIFDRLHMYQNTGIYSDDTESIERRMLSYVPNLSKYQRKEVLAFLGLQAPKVTESDKRYISFRNGVYDLKTSMLLEHSPEFIIPNQIPWNYNPDAFSLSMENALFDWCCDDGEIVTLLEELIGYSMFRENTFRKFFVIVGNKRNGKSKFLKVLFEFIGVENTSFISLENIDTRFQNALISGKLLNVGDDIENETCITQTSGLKKITSGDPMTVERKGQDPFEFVSYATLVFSANGIPFIKDQTGAVKDRMIVIPFNAHFEEEADNNNPNILDDLLTEESMEYLSKIGIEGLQRVLTNKRFTLPKCVKAAMKQYLLENDPVTAFISDNKDNIFGHSTADVYHMFEQYCKERDVSIKSITHKRLTQSIKKALHCRTQAEHGVNVFRP